ncbi:MAG: type IV secretory system conjugative DNA transfer family protein [Gemmataceae bacterium]
MSLAPDRGTVQLAVSRAAVGIVAAVVGIIAVDRFAHPNFSQTTRYGLTLAYFGSWFTLAYFLLGPRRTAVRLATEWMYDDAPPHTAMAARRQAHAIDQLISWMVWLALGFLGATLLRVLAAWHSELESLAGAMWYVMWLSLIGLLLLPLFGGFLFQDVFQQMRALREKEATSQSYRPRTLADLFAPTFYTDDGRLQLEPEGRFRAGTLNWSWSQLCSNSIVFGQTGSGKTACVLNAMLDGLLGSAHAQGRCPGGLLLDPKGDFTEKLANLMDRYGWRDRLIVIDPSQPYHTERWNPLDSRDDELELAARIAAVMEAARNKKAGADDTYWISEATKFLRHGIALIRATNAGFPASLTDILQLSTNIHFLQERIQALALSTPAEINAQDYFCGEWVLKDERTRTGVQGYISNMLDPFTLEPYRTIFTGRSTFSIADALDQGKIIFLKMPQAEKPMMTRVIGTALKLEFYREVRKRLDKPIPSFFFCDEFQSFLTTLEGFGDAEFFEVNRQSRHVNLVATQNLPSLLKYSPGNKSVIENLLGNITVKIFLRNTDKETNKFASELFGQEVTTTGGKSMGTGTGKYGFGSVTASSTDTYDGVAREERFSQLRIPSREDRGATFAEAIVHNAALPGQADRQKTRWPLHLI